ncbi:potassium transporter TrkG, partial [Methanocaldococcus sp.]
TKPIRALFDSVSFISNIGLSLGVVTINSPIVLKILGILLMWLGRLEIIPILVSLYFIVNKGFQINKNKGLYIK